MYHTKKHTRTTHAHYGQGMMQEKLGEKYYENCIYVDEDDVYNYTDEGQEIFNNYIDQMTRILNEVDIVDEDQLQQGE